MASKSTAKAELTKAVPFSTELTTKLEESAGALPKGFNIQRFTQNALALLNDHPELHKYPRSQIIGGLMKGAYLGLDFFSKEAYLVPYGDKLNYQTDYRGAMKLAKKYSIRPILDIDAKLVCDGDFFEETVEHGETTFVFKPKAFNKGTVIGAFAYARFKDGGLLLDTMTTEEIEKTRSVSKAKNSMAWATFWGQMALKTVIHRLCKRIELEFETPEQRTTFTEDVEIATDPVEVAEVEIANNENSEEFEMPFSDVEIVPAEESADGKG